MQEQFFNKSTFFLLPILGFSFDFYPENYENCYIAEVDGEYKLMVSFNHDDNFSFSHVKERLKAHSFYEKTLRNNNKIVMCFGIPSVFKADITCFIEGKYSCFSVKLKKLLERVIRKDGAIHAALYPTPFHRMELAKRLDVPYDVLVNSEIASKPDIKQELYNGPIAADELFD